MVGRAKSVRWKGTGKAIPRAVGPRKRNASFGSIQFLDASPRTLDSLHALCPPGRGSVASCAPRMLDRVPAAPVTAGPIRLLAVYRSAASLLRELSRALNQGQTLLKADTGLPAGTRLVLVMTTAALSAPIEVQGTVTACRPAAGRLAMTLRYDFDPEPHRSRLREALAELRRETRKPRREPRVPLALRADAAALLRGLSATVSDASRAGARLELVGRAPARGGLGRPAGDDARRQPPRQPPARAPGARGDVGRRAAPVGARAAAGGGGPIRRPLAGARAAHRGHPPLRRRAAGVAAGPDRPAGAGVPPATLKAGSPGRVAQTSQRVY